MSESAQAYGDNLPLWAMIRRDAIRAIAWCREAFSPVEEPVDPMLAFMSARRIVGTGRLAIAVFVVGFFAWAALAPLDSAVMAPGFLVVESHVKAIQHLEGGIVRDILVREGQTVSKNQLLIRLDDTDARTNLAILTDEHDALEAQEARLMAERDGLDHIVFPADLRSRASKPEVSAAMKGEENTFAAQRDALAKQIDIVGKRSEENASIIAGLKNEQVAVERQLKLIAQETAGIQTLYKQGLTTLPRLLALQRQAAELTGQRGQIMEKIAQTLTTNGENQLQAMGLKNQQLSDVVKDLRDTETKRFDLVSRMQSARDVLARQNIRSPVSGRIVDLAVHASGEVLKPGDTIMQIVPLKDAIEVEAHVRPEDADRVHVGMSARVSFGAYLARRLPMILGTVNNVSADRQVDERTGQAFFTVNVAVDRGKLSAYRDIRLMPGLPADVALDTGSHTALDYFVEPITDVFHRGMRER